MYENMYDCIRQVTFMYDTPFSNWNITCIGQALAADYAHIDGYHTFYSWSRIREGYSGVAIFCKTHLAPVRAEEGIERAMMSLK
jgi:exonuclease III